MAIHDHNEIEIKIAAKGVDVEAFRQYCFKRSPISFLCVVGPDTYYENGKQVVRHRKSKRAEGGHELTVKLRKSERSTRDRMEIDLFFSERTKQRDVEAFLAATGFVEAFTLTKKAHIFNFQDGEYKICVVIYDVCVGREFKEEDTQRFIEVEIEKGSEVSEQSAKRRLSAWIDDIKKHFGTALKNSEPLNESLYEIYSGKKYQTV